MDDPIERRVADERHRADLSQRLTAIEVSQKLYHDELKSIMEGHHVEIEAVKSAAMELHYALYGGPKADNVGLLERFRALLWKAGFATSAAIGLIGFGLKLFGPSLNKIALRIVGEDPVQQYFQQRQKKKIQMFNRKTGEYEYFIEFQPIGQQGQLGQKGSK